LDSIVLLKEKLEPY